MNNSLFGRVVGGLVLISIGVLFLLNMTGITDISIGYLFATFWPVFLIIAGLMHLANGGRHGSNFIGSIVLLAIGGYFLLRNMDIISLDPGSFFKFFLPFMLIVAGVYVMFKPRRKHGKPPVMKGDYTPPPPPPPPPLGPMESPLDAYFGTQEEQKKFGDSPNNYHAGHSGSTFSSHSHGKVEVMNKSGFIGDVHVGQDYFQLKPMNISHFIGDTIIDLTKAQIPYGETKINVSSFIGDVKVFIPDDMELGIVATSSAFIGDLKVLSHKEGGFMSSVQVESPYYREARKKVKLVVSVFIGDVKVNMVG